MYFAPVSFVDTNQEPPHTELGDADMARSIGRVLRDLRKQRSLSLHDLARDSGVSSSMLSQIENGRSTPSVAVLWKIAKALEVPLNRFLKDWELPAQPVLLRREDTPLRIAAQGKSVWRTLKPMGPQRKLEFYEITLRPGADDDTGPSAAGNWSNLALLEGELIVSFGQSRQVLRPGDTLQFPSHSAHSLINQGREKAIMYLVVSQAGFESQP